MKTISICLKQYHHKVFSIFHMGLPTQKKLSLLPVFCSSTSLTILLILCPNLFKLFPPENAAKNTNSAASPYLTPWSCPSRRWCVLVTSSPLPGMLLILPSLIDQSVSQSTPLICQSLIKYFDLATTFLFRLAKLVWKYLGITGEHFLGLGRHWVHSLLHNQQPCFHSACD